MPFGVHISKEKRSMKVAFEQELDVLANMKLKSICVQIFVCNPKSRAPTLDAADMIAIKSMIIQRDINLVIHGTYTDNPWGKNDASIENIKYELTVAHKLGATGVIVHLGAKANDVVALEYVLSNVSNLPATIRENVILWLEINAARPTKDTFETPAKIEALFKKIATCTTRGLKIGLCIDTAHLFACGVALDTADAAKIWMEDTISRLEKFSEVFGYDIPIMLHLNDSATKLESGKDAHASITYGNIWKPRDDEIVADGYIYLIHLAEKINMDVIFERNKEDIDKDLLILTNLI